MSKKLSVFLILIVFVCGTAFAAPKSVIMMVADGWGFEHLSAAEYYDNGGETKFFDWMTLLAMSTYSASGNGYDQEKAWSDFDYVRQGATDSAAAATALSTGVMTLDGRIGLDPEGERLKHLYQTAYERGKATGVITDVLLAHATPAGFAAYAESRRNYDEISTHMIAGTSIDVLMGTGHPYFDGDGKRLPPEEINDGRYRHVGGKQTWEGLRRGEVGTDADGDGSPHPWTLIETREQFQALGAGETPKRVLGLAQVASTLQGERAGDPFADAFVAPMTETVPTLAEMTRGALNVLGTNQNGLFLMVEGGAIDWAGHGNASGRLIEEQISFRDAVYAARDWIEANSSWSETLLIVTADHETGYLTGPAEDGVWAPVENRGKGNMPGMKWNSENHTNSLVPLFVKGAGVDVISAKAVDGDPVRGNYLHATELAKILHEFWK